MDAPHGVGEPDAQPVPIVVHRAGERQRPGMSARGRRQFFAVALFLVVALFFATTFRMAVVHGASMLPTYHDGDLVLVNKLGNLMHPLAKGDVVLVRKGDDVLIKRIAYLPGETIDLRQSPGFWRVADDFDVVGSSASGLLRVPPGNLVVLGDNRANSDDSRSFGPVPLSDVIGQVVNAPPRPSQAM